LDMNPAKDLKHVELNSRCALPGLFEGEDGNNPYTILQPPGKVVIVYDYNHTSREIDLNRREHFGKNTRLFMGDALGHWEGNTLVVDTANFNGHVAYSREIPYLRRFELTNPHAWLYIDVKELEGTVNQLAFRTWCAERSQQTRLADRHD